MHHSKSHSDFEQKTSKILCCLRFRLLIRPDDCRIAGS